MRVPSTAPGATRRRNRLRRGRDTSQPRAESYARLGSALQLKPPFQLLKDALHHVSGIAPQPKSWTAFGRGRTGRNASQFYLVLVE